MLSWFLHDAYLLLRIAQEENGPDVSKCSCFPFSQSTPTPTCRHISCKHLSITSRTQRQLSSTIFNLQADTSMSITDRRRNAMRRRAGGRCECRMRVCDHKGRRCSRGLISGYWEAHHRSRNGGDGLKNLIAMCATCHKNTRTYGRPR